MREWNPHVVKQEKSERIGERGREARRVKKEGENDRTGALRSKVMESLPILLFCLYVHMNCVGRHYANEHETRPKRSSSLLRKLHIYIQ